MTGLLPEPHDALPRIGIEKAMTLLDTLAACCYAYHVFKEPLVSDTEYEELRKRAKEKNPDRFRLFMSRPAYQYPSRIRDLAFYLQAKTASRRRA